MRKNILLPLVSCLVFLITTPEGRSEEKLPPPFKIIPQPKNVVLQRGQGLDPKKLDNLILKGNFKRPVMGNILSKLPIGKPEYNGSLVLVLDSSLKSVPSREGYILKISGNSAQIISKGEAGLFYGCVTLEQLIEDALEFQKPVPSCNITDFPDISYRAVHFDVKHHLDHMNYYYESIDRLAKYKINAIVFEFEDKLRYQRQPLVGAPQSISIDEMAALTGYAHERHIEITPLVQGLGHATYILKHEEYAGLRELPWNRWAFCPLNEGTYQVLFDLYRDAIKATPGSKYLHIGGDEVGNIGLCPRCKPTADKEGMLSLNLYWLKRVCEFAKENGRIPIFWDDMPLKYAGVYETTYEDRITGSETSGIWKQGIPKLEKLLLDFPDNCVYMRWNYSMAMQPGNIMALDWYKSHRLKTMIATATNTEGGMLFQEDERDKGEASSGIITIKSFIQLAAEKKIDGMLCTAWDDKSPHMDNYWRGFIAAAEYSWSTQGRTLDEFDAAWLQKEFGISLPDYKSLNSKLREGSVLWYEAFFKNGSRLDNENALQSFSRLEHWLPPVKNQEKVQIDCSSLLIELPDINSPGAWSRKYKERLDKSRIEISNYPELSQKLKELYNISRRNRYHWELALALYDLQMTAPSLLLALEQSDNPDKIQHIKGIERVKTALNDFEKVWAGLRDVYAETRFTSYPEGYVPDRYFHLASQKEELTWMIQPEEIFHEMINNWLKNQ